jgi:hypothetical protein
MLKLILMLQVLFCRDEGLGYLESIDMMHQRVHMFKSGGSIVNRIPVYITISHPS